MDISGKVIQLLPEVTGEGRNGPWKKQEFIIETPDQYPRKVCIAVWGDRIDMKQVNINDEVTVSINVESREYNGKWYTDVKAWKISKGGDTGPVDPEYPPPPDYIPPGEIIDNPADDLPF